jgi:DNA topoisomerase-1
MKKLFIVESPGKAKTIKKYLGEDFIVASTMGHIKDLPAKKLGIDIEPPLLTITYETMIGKEKVIKELKKHIEVCDEIYLAPDSDREGEIIAYHINEIIDEVCGKKNKKSKSVYRVTYNEISKQAILNSIANKKEIDKHMVEAQQARRILDRLVGYKVSPVLWRKIAKGLSAGRVQSVALKLICKKEEEIKNFIIKEYWSVGGVLDKTSITVDITKENAKKELLSQLDADAILEIAKKATWSVVDLKDKEKKRKPLAPFITSTLQQSAYNVLHLNVQQTMLYAQQLYEGVVLDDENPVALITYMRTDSTRISDEAIKAVRGYIKTELGDKYLPKTPNKYSTKDAAQDAHEAIRPIDPFITPESIKNKLKKEQYLIYNLIWTRFVASQINEAIYTTRSIVVCDKDKKLSGKITGSIIIFDGFLKVYNTKEEEEEDKKLPPNLTVGQEVSIISIDKKQHFTQPPARYSEATLVKELEQKGIGRPSTYVPILKTIRDRLYTELDAKKRFCSTKLGVEVYQILEDNMTKIMDYSFTAKMEEELDKIAQGEITRDSLIFEFYNYLIPAVEQFLAKKIEKQYEETALVCPECQNKLIIKWGKTGEFLGCTHFPTCKYTANFTKNENDEVVINKEKSDAFESLDISCDKCQKPMVKKMGRFGEFTACSGYPECNYILQEKTKALCPACNKDNLKKRSWKGKIFWGCGNYPNCKFAINGNLVEKTCPKCNYPFTKEDGSCLSKTCDSDVNGK